MHRALHDSLGTGGEMIEGGLVGLKGCQYPHPFGPKRCAYPAVSLAEPHVSASMARQPRQPSLRRAAFYDTAGPVGSAAWDGGRGGELWCDRDEETIWVWRRGAHSLRLQEY